MSLVAHAKSELERAGLFDEDSDYDGMLGKSVLELVEKFAEQGHSGMSASMTLSIFNQVASYKTLTPITTDPKEWMKVSEEEPMWQNVRSSDCFSNDGGKTHYSIEDEKREVRGTVSA